MVELAVGLNAELSFTVTDQDTAIALGSGDVAVLATPRGLAWVEAATCAAVAPALAATETTVGAKVSIDHVAVSRVGETVTARAEVVAVERRRIDFDIALVNADQATVMAGMVTRVRVDRGRFPSA